MRGHIQRRGKKSWRLKFDVGTDAAGKRQIRYVTVKGKRQDAERELTRLLGTLDAGTYVEPNKVTVADHLRAWLDGAHGLAPKTAERYRELAEQQIIPHLGAIPLQKLRPAKVQTWHEALLASGGKDGKPLSARTVGHAHRVLHRALQRAVESEALARNAASVIKPPNVEEEEIEILDAEQIATVLNRLAGHELYPIVFLALATGLRRGELLGLQWGDIDLDGGAFLKVERTLEETKTGLRLKPPKTKHGRRTLALPPSAVAMLRAHRVQQLELRMSLGLGRPGPEAFAFSNYDGSPRSPDNLSRDWKRAVRALKLPQVMFHALRHTHVSALIAGGLDVVTISRRIGHSSPVVTLKVYAHLFSKTDAKAASAIEATLRTARER
jgi:integrase